MAQPAASPDPLRIIGSVATERLVVRPVVEQDLDDLLAVNGDPEVTRFLPYATWQSRADALAWLRRMQSVVASGTGQQLVLARRADDKVIGTLLLFNYEKTSARLELGYVLGRASWQGGLMSEAIAAVCEHMFATGSVRRIEAEVNAANNASIRLLKKLGFTHEGTMRKRWIDKGVAHDSCFFGLLCDDWQQKRSAD